MNNIYDNNKVFSITLSSLRSNKAKSGSYNKVCVSIQTLPIYDHNRPFQDSQPLF